MVIRTFVCRSGVPSHSVWKSASLSLMPIALASSVVSSGSPEGDRHLGGRGLLGSRAAALSASTVFSAIEFLPGAPGTTQAFVPSPLNVALTGALATAVASLVEERAPSSWPRDRAPG